MRHSFPFLAAIALFAASCSGPGRPAGKTVFRYNEAAGITSLDPAFARDQAIIWATNQLYNGLVQLDEEMEVRPCIASRWDVSPDGREYLFHLRSDVFFHDSRAFPGGKGRRVRASDFVYSFGRITDRSVASPGAWIFNNADTGRSGGAFTAINDSTLSVRLRRPFPPFLRMLSMQYCSVVPEEAVRYFGPDFRGNPVGTGPFRLGTWTEGIKLVLLRNERYFETDGDEHLPHLDAVAITFVPDRQSAFLEFLKGNIDMMSGIDPTYKDELLTPDGRLREVYAGKINLLTLPYLNTEYLGFVVAPSSGTGRVVPKGVRRAVNMSFDRVKMIRYLRNNIGIPGLQGITPAGLPSFDRSKQHYRYDPEAARRELASAGYPGGRGLPALTLTSTPDYLDICKYVQHQAAAIGINLEIDVNQPAAVKEMKAAARLPFFRASWIADYPDAENYLSMFLTRNFCPGGPNYTHYSNPEFDRLYDLAMVTTNDSIRYSIYRTMESIMMEEAPVVVLYYDQVLRFVRKDVEGLGINPMNLLTLKYVRKKS